MPVAYEWIVEEVDAHGDIIDTSAFPTAAQALGYARHAPGAGWHWEIGLTRNVGDDDVGLQDRQWAYISEGKLPTHFDGGASIPHRFRRELQQALIP
jgi:hypothetical protein